MTRYAIAASVLLALLAPASAAAQAGERAAVSGVVVDAGTGQPVSGAAVVLPELERMAVSDEQGRFELRDLPAGEHRWIIRRVGYSTWEESAEVADGDRFTVGLLAAPVRLEAVSVQVNRLERRRRSFGGQVRVLEQREILAAAVHSTADVVRYRALVGATVCPVMGGTGSEATAASTGALCVMGQYGRPERVLVFIDEQPIMDDPQSALMAYHPSEIFTIETYDGGRMVRIYTNHFVQHTRVVLSPIRRF